MLLFFSDQRPQHPTGVQEFDAHRRTVRRVFPPRRFTPDYADFPFFSIHSSLINRHRPVASSTAPAASTGGAGVSFAASQEGQKVVGRNPALSNGVGGRPIMTTKDSDVVSSCSPLQICTLLLEPDDLFPYRIYRVLLPWLRPSPSPPLTNPPFLSTLPRPRSTLRPPTVPPVDELSAQLAP